MQPSYPIGDRPETLHSRGCRVLAYVLETRSTFALSDSDLQLADHVYPVAIAHHEISALAVDRLSEARHWILAALQCRRAFDASRLAALQDGAAPSVPPAGGKQPGAAVPLSPAPRPLAPIGGAVQPRPAPRPSPADIAF